MSYSVAVIIIFTLRTITTKSRAPNVVVPDLFQVGQPSPLVDESANDVGGGGLDEKTKPIPFLIRNTTAEGMPISIGSLRAVNTPAFSSFNPFIKRLPPPKKYVFEPRQVLPGDIVDPYNYLRALFRGEVILTSDRLPTFASPRVTGAATSSTVSKVPAAMYTSRSPQGFNPMMYSKKKATTTTTTSRPASASFFGSIGLSSKGEGTDVERKPLPVGMLGTPSPNFKDFNFRDFVNQMKQKKAMGGKINLSKHKPSNVKQDKVNTITQTDTTTSRSPAIEMFIESVKNKNLPSIDSVMNNFKQNKDEVKTLQSVVTGLKNQDIPTMEDIMRKINSQQSVSSFPTIPAVPGKDTVASKNKFMFETAVPKPSKSKGSFNPLPAVPDLEISKDQNRKPKSQFKHFPSTTTERQVVEMRKGKALTFDPRIETSGERRGKALQKLKDILSPTAKLESVSLESNIKNNPNLYKTSFSPSTQRSAERFQAPEETTTSKPRTPHGTIRSEIMSILKSKKTTKSSSSQRTTLSPQLFELLNLKTTTLPPIRQTTSRAEVLALLRQFLQSVKPATTTATTTTTTTKRTTTRPPETTARSSRLLKSPSLRFDDPAPPSVLSQPRLNIDLTSISPNSYLPRVTTASPVNPRSPFPNMEPPQHDIIKSNIYLPDPRDVIVQTSTVHPLSPFQHLEPPSPDGSLEFGPAIDFFPTPGDPNAGFLTGTISNSNRAIPRSDQSQKLPKFSMLPYDPARPHLPPQSQSPTEKPGQFKLFLGGGDQDLSRPQRKFNGHKAQSVPVPRTRMVAPESKRPSMARRLVVDGPTERGMTPLEMLARGTVPTRRPDQAVFGTPKSRLLESQTPLETLAARLKDGGHNAFGFGEIEPVERSRYQREREQSHHMDLLPVHDRGKKVRIPGANFDYNQLPGVKTGTTAVGLVEHRNNNQPLFHVPIFTTPIPKNGQFLNINSNPIRGIQTGLKRISSAIADSIKIPHIPTPAEGFQRLKKIFGGNVGAAQEVRDIQITPAPRHLNRRLDTFSRYTRFGNGSQSHLSCGNIIIISFLLTRVVNFVFY